MLLAMLPGMLLAMLRDTAGLQSWADDLDW
jgi:hypothetical protein